MHKIKHTAKQNIDRRTMQCHLAVKGLKEWNKSLLTSLGGEEFSWKRRSKEKLPLLSIPPSPSLSLPIFPPAMEFTAEITYLFHLIGFLIALT